MTDSPAVTIITALYKPGALLGAFLERLDATVDAGTQVVVVDDFSNDGTLERLERWRAGRDGIVLIRNTRNRGVAVSRNLAVAEARGEFVWFVDHDDLWDPEITRRMRAAAESTDDVVVCRAQYRFDPEIPGPIVDGVAEPGRVSGERALWMMAEGLLHGFLWSKLIRREALGLVPFPPLTSQSDVAGLANVLLSARSVVFIPDVLYFYINTPGSITRVRQPNLDNLGIAHEAVVGAARSTSMSDDALLDYFTCWFYCRALVLTPIRQRSPGALRREGLRRARAILRGIDLGRTRRFSTPIWLLMCGTRWTPGLTAAAVSVLYAVLDARRRAVARGTVPAIATAQFSNTGGEGTRQ
jgi:glycosyltransferase involved in cell wall biosynthesis